MTTHRTVLEVTQARIERYGRANGDGRVAHHGLVTGAGIVDDGGVDRARTNGLRPGRRGAIGHQRTAHPPVPVVKDARRCLPAIKIGRAHV